MTQTDFDLLDEWAAGDRRAARTLLDRHFGAVFRFFRNKVDDKVEDLVQDTMLACLRSREQFRRDSSFRSFLFATARNVLLAHLRKHRRDADVVDFEATSIWDLGPSPSSVAAQRAEQRLLLEAIRRIPVEQQILLELYHWEGLTGPQICDVLGVGEAALRSRLFRAKQELRRRMEELASSPEQLRSTCDTLDEWAASLRALVDLSARDS